MDYRIIQWQRTETQFVAILQAAISFDAETIRMQDQHGPETLLVGRLSLTGREEPYALAYSRHDLTLDEAKVMARRWIEAQRSVRRP